MALSALGSGWRERVEVAAQALGAAPLPELTLVALERLLDLVVTWNAKVDLTAARDADELVDLFVADALVVAKLPRSSEETDWVDVGSGAGAPAIPLALFAPELRMTLVEPKAKRVAFLRSALGSLGRSDVRVVRARSDDIAAGAHDVAMSRATLDPESWAREGTRIARRAVWILLARAEVPEVTGWRVDEDRSYAWPLTGAPRRAVRLARMS
jgi:16S rRNA (guanine527-N7)-methyltransferase